MKKGELRKDAIIKTAERLFFERGYDDTSVQDILDALSLSKGGFYHYFDTKQSLLEEISRQRVLASLETLSTQLRSGRMDPIRRMNALLSFVNMFNRETPDFIAIALRISYLEDDVNFRDRTRAFMMEQLKPLMERVVFDGVKDGSFFSRYPGRVGEIVLMLTFDISDNVSRTLALNSSRPDCMLTIIDTLNAYRDSVENLLGAPYGKIDLFEPEQIMSVFRQTAVELERLKGKNTK